MKILKVLILVFIVWIQIAVGGEYTILYNHLMDIETGAVDINSLNKIANYSLDALLFDKLSFKEDTPLKKILGISSRIVKLYLITRPLAHLSQVANHELFGHGARLREFGGKNLSYWIDWPPPYGSGRGSVRGRLPQDIGIDRKIIVKTGGFEASFLYSSLLQKEFLRKGNMPYYDIFVFYRTKMELTKYLLLRTEDLDSPRFKGGGDTEGYIVEINSKYLGEVEYKDYKLTSKKLKKAALLSLLDPLLYISIYNFGNYLLTGRKELKVFMMNIKEVGFLPGVRFNLSPFGYEYYLDVYLKIDNRFINSYLRIGDNTFAKFWGLGVDINNLISIKSTMVDAQIDLFYQPPITYGDKINQGLNKFGANITLNFTFSKIKGIIKPKIIIGYKTEGYIIGRVLKKGVYGSLGVCFYLPN